MEASASYQFTAHNDAADTGNPMHDDAGAQALDFRGALVPGVTVYGYLTHAVIAHFGEAWLDRGWMQVRFRRPVYVADRLQVRIEGDDQETIAVAAQNADGDDCVVGTAAMTRAKSSLDGFWQEVIPPHRPLPAAKRAPERTDLERDPLLGTMTACFEPDLAAGFIADMQDAHPVYSTGVTHPAWLLRQANLVVDQNLALGPWIHTASELENHARVNNGDALEVRAKFVGFEARKGHEYADLDVAICRAGGPATLCLRILHRFIYKLADSGEQS